MKTFISAAFLLLFLSAQLFADWQWNDPAPQGNRLSAAAASPGNSTLVAVGDYGAVVYKTGSSPWVNAGPIADGAALDTVVWKGDRFLATGPNAGLWQSTDGAVWTLRDSNVKGYYLFDLGTSLVALGADTSWVSTSGTAFQSYSLGSNSVYITAAASGSNIILVGDKGLLASSSDGATWKNESLDPNLYLYATAGGPMGFLIASATASNGYYYPAPLYTSGSASGFSQMAPPAGTRGALSIVTGAQDWVFSDSASNLLYQRSAGNWGGVTDSLTGKQSNFVPYASLILGGTSSLLVGNRGSIAELSTSGTLLPLNPTAIVSNYLSPTRFAGVGIGNLCVAMDFNTSRLTDARYYLTTDGVTWTRRLPAPVSALSALSVSGTELLGYSAGYGANAAGFYHSSDGGNWEILANITDPQTGSVAISDPVVSFAVNSDRSAMVALSRKEIYSLDGRYTAVRGLYYSSNWSDWTPVPMPEVTSQQPPNEDAVENISWDGTHFVLLLHPGRIFLSSDGKNWSRLPALPDDSKSQLQTSYNSTAIPAANIAGSVASNGQMLVARAVKLASDGSRITTLPSDAERFFVFDQGRWWPCPVSSPVDPSLRQVFWNGSEFCATGEGEILCSPDGFNWTSNSVAAPVSKLLWTGSRFIAFTDAFAVLSHEGDFTGGTAIESPTLLPRVTDPSLTAAAQSYQLQANLSVTTSWTVTGAPSWLTVTPSSGVGPATLTVSVAQNKSTTARGAVLQVAGLTHLLFQQGTKTVTTIAASYRSSTVTIPFSGDWSASAEPSNLVQFPKNSTTGRGALKVSLQANNTPNARTITVNVNGQDYTITQQGQSVAALRAGSYSGLVGSLFEGFAPSSPDNFDFFSGWIKLAVTGTTSKNPTGAYSASLTYFDGIQSTVFRGSGTLNALGAIENATWKSSGKIPQTLSVNLSVTDDYGLNKWVSGNLTLSGTALAFFAGKQVYDGKTNALAAEDVGKATFFLAPTDSSSFSGNNGVASATVLSNGNVRLVGTLADGTPISASTYVWGAAGNSLMIPFFFPAAKGKGVANGYATKDLSNPESDWSGPAFLSVSGTDPVNLTASVARYKVPGAGQTVMSWGHSGTLPAFKLQPSDSMLPAVTGTATLGTKNALSVVIPPSTSPVPLSLNVATGLVTGSIIDPDTKIKFSVYGAVNQKYQNLTIDSGAVAGFSKTTPAAFSILSQ